MKTIILSGGRINQEFAIEYLKTNPYDYLICVDKAMEFCDRCNIRPDIILGDFDSVNALVLSKFEKTDIPIRYFNPQKDLTDMQIAIEHAIEASSDEITVFGATGTRIDHMLGSIHTLVIPLKRNILCEIIDENNKIELIDKYKELKKSEQYGKYVSLIPLTEKVTNVTLKGFKYPLDDYDMTYGNSLGVSNEIQEETACIKLEKGILILIQSKD